MENEGMVSSGRIALGMRVLFSPSKLGSFNMDGGTLNVFATTRSKMFTPNGDGEDDIVVFDVSSDADEHEGVNSWEVRFYDPGQKIFFIDKVETFKPRRNLLDAEAFGHRELYKFFLAH